MRSCDTLNGLLRSSTVGFTWCKNLVCTNRQNVSERSNRWWREHGVCSRTCYLASGGTEQEDAE